MAKQIIDRAPDNATVTIKLEARSINANNLMWALLSDVSRAKPQGRCHSTEVWKCLFMAACGHQVQFVLGLDGNPFPVGFSTSRMSKSQMADLITFILQWGDEQGVAWSDNA
jgi:hypothetical protein